MVDDQNVEPLQYGMAVDNDHQGMSLALKLARQAFDLGEVPVGAVLVQEGKLIGQGYNSPIDSLDPTAHAEIAAIRDASQQIGNYRLTGSTLYVTVEPCSMCAGAIVHSRIERIVFGATEPKSGAICSAAQFFDSEFINHKPQSEGGVMAQECANLMTEFFAKRRKAKKKLKANVQPSSSDNT